MPTPTVYTDALLDDICQRLAEGEPLAEICRTPGYPATSTVRRWQLETPEISQRIAAAREDGEDRIAADCLRIADTPLEAFMEEHERREKPKPANASDDYVPEFEFVVIRRTRKDALEHRKFQVETRLKLLAKWNPKRWGDKVQHADADGNVLATPQFIINPIAAKAGE